jgi:hypothetical protein
MSTLDTSSKKTTAKAVVIAEEKQKVAKPLAAKSSVEAKTGAAKPSVSKESIKGSRSQSSGGQQALAAEDRHRMISTAAYFRAQQRGFSGGDQVADWLSGEAEIDAMSMARVAG